MAVTANQVQQLYLAYFGRPAEQAGLSYWTSTDATIDDISASFAQQAEYTNVYGSLNRVQTIQQLYLNLFNRAANNEEINYWNASSDVSVDRMALALVNGATGNDSVTLSNKADIAQVITNQQGADATADQVKAALPTEATQIYTGDNTAEASAAAAAALTAARTDAVNSTSYQIAGGVFEDAAGTDVDPAAGANFFAATDANITLKAAGAAGTPTTVTLDADSAVTNLHLSGTTVANGSTIAFSELADEGTVTTLDLDVSNVKGATGTLNIDVAGLTELTTVDGSGSSTSLTIAGTNDLASLTSITTGSGADTVTVSGNHDAALTVTTGAGNDVVNITLGAKAVNVDAGAGIDIVTVAGVGSAHNGTITLGAGADALVLGTADASFDNVTGTTVTAKSLAADVLKVTDFSSEDTINISELTVDTSLTTLSTSVNAQINQATSLLNAVNVVAGATAADDVAAFQYGGNTYVFHNDAAASGGGTDVVAAGDALIELTGYTGTVNAVA
ncbi:hypothetical protein ACVA51_19525 [Pseudomonas luteola]